MTNKELHDKLLDEKNEALWNYLQNKYDIALNVSDTYESGITEIDCTFSITLNKSQLTPEVFVHELLHLYIIDKYIHVSNVLYNYASQNIIISKWLNNKCLDFIHNILSHMLMYPIYINMGYKSDLFSEQEDDDYINRLMSNLNCINMRGYYMPYSINSFICYQIEMQGNCLERHNYKECLKILKDKNIELYLIVDDLMSKWNLSLSKSSLNDLLLLFLKLFESWIVNNFGKEYLPHNKPAIY